MSFVPFGFVFTMVVMVWLSLSGAARSERAGESESGLLSELLGVTAGAERTSQPATRSALLGLTQAGADVRASQVFVVEVHLGVL
jgi:hypothetical protein